MAKQITIPNWQQGGTLSQIAQKYNTSVNELLRLNPNIKDPNKIMEGQKLNVPELSNTLNTQTSTPTGGALPYTQAKERVLPDNEATDKIGAFQTLMRQIMEKASLQRKEGALNKFQDMGLDPNKVSGGTMSDILGYVKSMATEGIEDQYTQTLETVDRMMQ